MIVIQTVEQLEKSRCTGCGVCVNACPNGSVFMKADEEGFSCPSVDISICSNCGNCATYCPAIYPPIVPESQQEPQVYAAWSLDEEVRYNSTSGGIFTELAKAVLQQKGYVTGARYTDRHLVEHALIDRKEDIATLRQSKYVQSETKDIYKKVEKALQTEKPVLFVGTPCQCAGLKVFLQKPYQNLIFCDFICRGVNSPKVYLKYLEELESEYGSRIKQVWFKNKIYGWNNFCTKIIFEDGQEYLGGRDTDPFMYGYIKKNLNLYMRPSCGQCQFKGIKRPVDITLGDFWGVKLRKNNYSTDCGVSMLMVHSEKGKNFFDILKPALYYEVHSLEDVGTFNMCLLNSASQSDTRNKFWVNINNNPFSKVIENFKTPGE
ncbi:MAG: Coenzyme F420 hydrogenase/dehydrogenase, beta subunit C-terminal domain [Bacillota bacterium]